MDVEKEQAQAEEQAQDATVEVQEAPVEEAPAEETPVEEAPQEEVEEVEQPDDGSSEPVEGEDVPDPADDEESKTVIKPGGLGAPNLGPENDPRLKDNVSSGE